MQCILKKAVIMKRVKISTKERLEFLCIKVQTTIRQTHERLSILNHTFYFLHSTQGRKLF